MNNRISASMLLLISFCSIGQESPVEWCEYESDQRIYSLARQNGNSFVTGEKMPVKMVNSFKFYSYEVDELKVEKKEFPRNLTGNAANVAALEPEPRVLTFQQFRFTSKGINKLDLGFCRILTLS